MHAGSGGHRLLLEGPADGPALSGGGVAGIFSDRQKFVYRDQQAISVSTPVNGATVAVPTLDWEPVPGTETYEVTLLRGNGTQVTQRQTHSTSFTPIGP